jgi:squalene synthase HpnC
MPVDHYENFPVASLVLPRRLRKPIEAIYRFARSADDIADEGVLPADERLRLLAEYDRGLDAIDAGHRPSDAVFGPLAIAVREHDLSTPLLRDLLSAFRQDVVQQRYASFAELEDYCRRSANPIGRLLLHLFERSEDRLLAHSDRVCTALQLANHWQDVWIDWQKGRLYLPQDELARFGVREADIAARSADERWHRLMQFQVARAREMLESGAPLARSLGGRIGLELKLIVAGGRCILGKIEGAGGDVFRYRPQLTARDWLRLTAGALLA